MSPRAVLATIFLVAMLIGGNFTALKFALDHSTPLLIAGMRTVIGGSVLLGVALARGERLPTERSILRKIFVVSFSITTVSSGLLVFGVNRVPAGVASLVSSTMPLFTAVLSFVLLSVAVTRRGAVGLIVGLLGTAVLVSPSLGGETTAIGIGALVISAMAWAFGTVFMKWKDFGGISPIMLVGVQLAMSAAVLIPTALIIEGTADTDWSAGLFVPLLYAAVPANALTFALMAMVAQRASPTQAAATAYLIPVFGVLFGWLIRNEVLGPAELLGGALVITGVFVVVNSPAASRPTTPR